jgi:3,4-dihydroxy 2-butanone 4-phosphate synthase/GTP cyclohydrolase II
VIEAEGILEIMREGFGLIRDPRFNFMSFPDDVFISPSNLRRYNLQAGLSLKVICRAPRDAKDKFISVESVVSVEGTPIEEYVVPVAFDKLTPLFPTERIILENRRTRAVASRVVDIVAPLGKGQRGLICAPVTEERARTLSLGPMVPRNEEAFGTHFTVSVDAATGITTGISAHDRARTIRLLADPATQPGDLVQPGHIFPLQGKPGGVLRRAGHTEAAIDFARLAGLEPAGVICEILSEDGTMARLPELIEIARRHDLKLCTIAALIEWRQVRERLIEFEEERPIHTVAGPFRLRIYRSILSGSYHFALVRGGIDSQHPTLVRVHREDLIEDLFGTEIGEFTSPSLQVALRQIARHGSGVLIYMQRDSPTASVREHLTAKQGKTRTPMDLRDYGTGAQILHELGVRDLRLISNHPRKVVGLEGHGLRIVQMVELA